MKTLTKRETEILSFPLSLGFAGLGWIGLNRMQHLLKIPNCHCTGIVEPSIANAQKALNEVPGAQIFEDFDDMIADPDINAVVIATPSAMHASQTIAALEAGKNVFCQKPLGRNAREVKTILEAAQKNNKLLKLDLCYRQTKAFEAVKKTIDSNEVGEIFAVNLVFHNAYGPDKEWFYNKSLAGGGCVLDLGIHMLDLAMWALGFPEIKSIQSKLFKEGKRIFGNTEEVEDFATVNMTTQQNVAIDLQCSWNLHAGKDAAIEAVFYGTQGGVAFKNVNGSFYDFIAEKYTGTKTETIVSQPEDWGGNACRSWAKEVMNDAGFNVESANEYLQLAKLIDRIYA